MSELAAADASLIRAAGDIIQDHFCEGQHHTGAALRKSSGTVFCAVNLETTVGALATCAEVIAIGMARAAGDCEIETVVAVNRDGKVVSPCGRCREVIADYSSSARVIAPGANEPIVVSIYTLLPNKYFRNTN